MKKKILNLSVFLVLLFLGCEDPNDPKTWIKKLDEPLYRDKAIRELRRLYTEELKKNNNNPNAHGVKKLQDLIVPNLIKSWKLYKQSENRKEIVISLYQIQDRRAIPVFINSLYFRRGDQATEIMAVKAAEALGIMKVKKAVPHIVRHLRRIIGNRAIDNQLKRSFVESLGLIGDKRASKAIVKILETSADEQDFFVNKIAAIALERLGDPRTVRPLIRGLFMIGRGATIYQQCRRALVRIGPPAVQPLIKAMKNEDPALNEMAQRLDFETINPGIVQEKCARVLGDIGDSSATDELIKLLEDERPVVRGHAAIALGKIGDKKAFEEVKPILFMEPHGAHPGVIEALVRFGDARALPDLLKFMKTQEYPYPGVRLTAALAYTQLGTQNEISPFKEAIKAEQNPEIKKQMKTFLVRLEAAAECKKSIPCWIRKLDHKNWRIQEKAAIMLRLLGKGKPEVRKALLNKVGIKHLKVRAQILQALDQLSPNGCQECIPVLEELIKKEEGKRMWAIISNDAQCLIYRLMHRKKSS
jgi:HEAT repeat protein